MRLAELIRLDFTETPLAAGAALMLCCLLRPAEVCPRYGEIIDFGSFGVYAAVHNVSSGKRVSTMKTRNAYCQIVLPKYVMDIVRNSREALRRQGYSDEDIKDAYIVHHRQDIHRPADPRDISNYVKNKLELLGYLEKKCPAERLADSAYIVSQDELGQKAFASGELITYIRTTVSAYTIGYAGRIKLEGMASALGVQLFRNTRRNHLIEDCGLRDDPGALAFLMHQSMTGQVQSDSYRSFTDTTGQQYLYSKLCRDRHGCPAPEKENTRTSIVQLPDGRQEIRIPPVSGSSRQGDALITLVLTNVQPGDVIEAHAPGGCFLDISSE